MAWFRRGFIARRVVKVFPVRAEREHVWVLWVGGGLAVWLVIGALAAVVIGRGIRLADERTTDRAQSGRMDVPDVAARRSSHPTAARPRIPLPPIGVGLAAIAFVLETVGFVGRLTGSGSDVLSMDAPFSLPRMYVTALFAGAALLALAGAATLPGRRGWWIGVGAITGSVAVIKASGTLHAQVFAVVRRDVGLAAAELLSVAVASAALVALYVSSRGDRRDRRRVLLALAGYAVAAVGLSGLSLFAAGVFGATSSWAAGTTFVEEASEALAAVAVLLAVLAGVAPRLVLPDGWPLRRTADAHTLDAPDRLPLRTAPGGDGPL